MVIDVSGNHFSRSGDVPGNVVVAPKVGDAWQYYAANAGWQPLTPNSNRFIIATGSKTSSFQTVSNGLMALDAAPELGAVRISGEEHIQDGATSIIACDEETATISSNSTSSWREVARVTVSDSSGKDIFVAFNFHAVSTQSSTTRGRLRIRRGNSYVWGGSSGAQLEHNDGGDTFTASFTEAVTAHSSVTYTCEHRKNTNNENVNISHRTVYAHEAKN